VLLARVRRTITIAGVIVVFLVLAGATYQGVATALERRQFRHPGRMVDAGGHQLHIFCTGTGSPTVVLEAGGAGMSAAWGWVQPRVQTVTRVCSYDRAGLGWSEAGDRSYDLEEVAPSLKALLDRAGEHPPFVLAGQGLGAAFATIYASRFGDEVAAVVLIDPPSDTAAPSVTSTTRLVNASPWLARAGLLRAMRILSKNAAGLPEPAAGALSTFLNRPDHLTRAARELSRWNQTVARADESPVRPAITVIRVDAAGPGRVAFLTRPSQADVAAAAIIQTVDTVRRQTSS
jgi:pimeloyl-ACP methyl ester carboxylesterase